MLYSVNKKLYMLNIKLLGLSAVGEECESDYRSHVLFCIRIILFYETGKGGRGTLRGGD